MVPYAARNNLRLIALNTRDYPGSSPFSSEELAAMSNPDKAVQARALQNQAEEIAEFLVHIIKEYQIPATSPSGGGLALMGWSLGNILPLAFLANADAYAPEHVELLGRYLRTVVLHGERDSILSSLPGVDRPTFFRLDPSLICVGEAPPIAETSVSNWPLLNPGIPLDERLRIFPIWASSYYTPVEDLLSLTLPTAAARIVLDNNLAEGNSTSPFTASVSRMSAAELESITYHDAFTRLMQSLGRVDISLFQDNFSRALVEQSDDDSGTIWPDCKVLLSWCDMTIIDCMLSSAYITKTAKKGHVGRRVEVVQIERANHFVRRCKLCRYC